MPESQDVVILADFWYISFLKTNKSSRQMENIIEAIKINNLWNNITVVSHSSYSVETPEFENISATCDDYVLRSVNQKRLLTKIEKYLNNAQTHS